MIKRIKVHNMDSLKDPSYRFPGNYGVEKFLELFSGMSQFYLIFFHSLNFAITYDENFSQFLWCKTFLRFHCWCCYGSTIIVVAIYAMILYGIAMCDEHKTHIAMMMMITIWCCNSISREKSSSSSMKWKSFSCWFLRWLYSVLI
jgi:hypothetical protein